MWASKPFGDADSGFLCDFCWGACLLRLLVVVWRADWAARCSGFDKGEELGVFRGATYFGTLQVLQVNKNTQIKNVTEERWRPAIEHTCEKIIQQDYDSMVTLSIFQNCVELSESYSSRTFQFFHIASLVYAKRIRKGICFIVMERKTKRLMCSMIELPLGTPVAKQEAVIASFNAARLGKPAPTAETFGFGEEVTGDGDGYLAPRQEGFGFGDEPVETAKECKAIAPLQASNHGGFRQVRYDIASPYLICRALYSICILFCVI